MIKVENIVLKGRIAVLEGTVRGELPAWRDKHAVIPRQLAPPPSLV